MPFVIVALTLFTTLTATDVDAATDAELLALAKKFSPVLILTEETGRKWGAIKVLKPEPVGIMGATSADNIRFNIEDRVIEDRVVPFSDETWFNPMDVNSNGRTWDPRINLLENKFAFFNGLEDLTFTATVGSDNMDPGESYTLKDAHFNFSGKETTGWNAEYERIGENFPNTAYVHIYQRTVEEYRDTYNPVTVIQYKYFYPYNDWWNNHEGDWQGIDVVVSSNDINTAQILGVEYRFHSAWLNYYKGDFAAEPTITNSFTFNPKTAVRVIPGPSSIENTHPVVYVGAGSHAAYPVGGNIKIYHTALELLGSIGGEEGEEEVQGTVGGDYEYMTHTGLVLSTQVDGAQSKLWERYDLQLLPEPVLDYDNNMGLADTLSWLGARIRWGTPDVGGLGESVSPEKGPYNSAADCFSSEIIPPPDCGWGELKFFEVGRTGFGVSLTKYEMYHRDLPYDNYHHWAILGDETWSGTVNLLGDVVVFPGATLRIRAGTVVNFAPTDRHQFKEGNNSLSEIFVYGTLRSEGTSEESVALGGTEGKSERWGGLRVLGSGSVNLGNYTAVRNTKPAKPVSAGSRVEASPVSAALRWEPVNDPVISYQTRLSTDGTTWPEWSDWTEEYGEGNTYKYIETDLREAKDYWLSVRAVNKTPFDPGDVYWASDPLEVKVTTLGTEDPGEVVLEPTSPRVGQAVTATLTDEDGYIAGSVWTWEHRLVGGTTWTALTGSEDTAESSVYTPKATDLGKELRARVSYRDGHGTNTDMAESAVSAAVVGNQAPVITGSAAVPYAENATVDVGNYTASDPDGHNIQWLALAGMDASHFALTGTDTDATRALRFKHAPDYETKNTYSVALKVKDQPGEVMGTAEDPNASLTTTLEVMVTITNVEEAGSVSIPSTEPRVGHPVTATLADPDGQITGASWTWEREEGSTWVTVSSSGASGTTAEAYPELSSYEPQTADIGHRLRARVSYRDGASADATDRKSAASDPTASVVVGVPPAPALEAVAGDGQVALTWTAPSSDGGSPILRYRVRYYKADKSDEAQAVWHEVPGGAAAQDTTIEKLTNRTAYVFQVVAENAVGRGVPAEASATPQAPVCSIVGPLQPTVVENTPTTEAVGTYTLSDDGCGEAEWLALGSTDASAFSLQGSGASRTLHFLSPPNYEAQRSYWITVRMRWGRTGYHLPMAVTVSNVEEAGQVALTGGLPPQAGRAVVAQLTDPDGQITGASWTWQRRSSATSSWEAVPSGASGTSDGSSAELSSYTPQAEEVGWQIRATVAYTDGHGPNKSAQSAASAAILGKPGVPPDLEADPGDRQVALSWSAAEANGSPILRYHVRYYKADKSDQAEAVWHEVPGGAAAQDTTIEELTNRTAYVFQVVAENAVGRGVPAAVEATPQAPACSIAGPFTPTVAENTPTTEAVGTYTISGDGCGVAEWLALAGADASAFALQGSGASRTLHFLSPSNYEAQRSYGVTVRIRWGRTVALRPMVVTVSNVEEAGQVALTGGLPPQAGRAVVAQLTDPDGQITGASWTWQRRSSATSSWEAVPSGASGTSDGSSAELSSYTPQAEEVGWQIRATVAYTDGHGPNKSAQSAASAAIIGKPGVPPDLEADPGDGQVALTWTVPSSDGGSSILRYRVRYYQADLSDQAQAIWHEVPGGATARDTTIGGLTNKTAYVFQVLAENAAGRGVWAAAEATPQAPVCSIAGPTAPTVAENTPTTTALGTYTLSGDGCGVAVWLTLGGTDQRAFQLQGSGASRTLHFLAAPDYETKSSYEVTVRVQVGSEERSVSVTVSVSNVEEAGQVALTGGLPPQEGRAVVAQLTDPDGQITGASWTWQRRSSATGSWEAVPSGASGTSDASGSSVAELSRYTPQAADVGFQVRASVTYTDGHGPNKSRQSDASTAVIGKPGVPPDFEAEPGDRQVALTWSAAAANGSPILRYRVRYYKADLSDQAEAIWHEVPGEAVARDTTIAELANDTAYLFQVLAENEVGRGGWAEAEATPEAPPCMLEGPSAATVAENTPTTNAVATYTPSGDGCGAASWLALGGTDQSAFQLQGSGTSRTLHFLAAPDYETKNSYQVTVRLQAGSEERSVAVAVAVSNVEEAGQVALTGGLPPQEDRAVVAQLTDPDGQITGASWTWQRRSSATSSWEAVPSGAAGTTGTASSAELSRYTPQAEDVGWQVRANVTYTDGQGPNKSQHSDASAAIIGKPGTPQLTAEPGDRQVALTWSAAAANGSPILRYQVRYYQADLSDQAEAIWHEVPGGATARDTTLAGLPNDTAYLFQVVAENEVGRGGWAEAEATPEAPPCTLEGPAAATVAENTPTTSAVATYTPSGDGCGAVSWLALGGTDQSAFQLQGSGAARTLHFLAAPDYETKNSYQVTVRLQAGSEEKSVAVAVAVSNVEEAGQVALTGGLPPQEDRAVVAQLTDPDGQITGASWTWQRRSSATRSWEAVASGASGTSGTTGTASSAELSSYTPQAEDVGWQVRASVTYTDGHGPNKSQHSDASAAIIGKPGPPQTVQAEPGRRQVTLSWSAPASDGGSPITRYEYRESRDGGTTWYSWISLNLDTKTILGGSPNQEYTLEVRAVNKVGAGPSVQVQATPLAANQAPTLEGPKNPSFTENGTGSVGRYEAGDPDNTPIRWLALAGTDASAFQLQGSGASRTLHFVTAPDYETKNSYQVTVQVSDESLTTSLEVTVSVSNVEEAGQVALTGGLPPQEDRAVVAQLTDPDGQITGASWTWQRRSSSTSSWEAVASGASGTSDGSSAELSSYTPQAQDVGWQVRATVTYTDGQGPNKSAQSSASATVIGKPGPPQNLAADPGDEQVALSWSAPASDGGSSITGYAYRYSTDGGTTWEQDWPTQADVTTTSAVVDGLTNGTTYTFQVRAHNNVGAGPAAQETAAPVEPPNRAPTLTGPKEPSGNENSTSSLGTYTASDPDGDPLTWSLSGSDDSAFELQGSGTSRTLHFDSAPNYEAKSSYEVTVEVSDESLSASVEVDVSVTNVEEAGSVSLSSTAPQVGTAITATLSDPDGNVSNLRWSWLRFSGSGTAEGTAEEGVEGANGTTPTSTFTPSSAVLGLRLRARVLYDDGHGTGKSAESAQTDPIKGPPWAPQDLEADPGDGQVALSWSAPSRLGGLTLQRYEYRHRARGGRWSDWTSAGLATEQTVSPLTNGTEYTFEVRAVNEAGEGLVAQTTATPEASNQAPTLTGPEEPSGNENSTSSLGTYTARDDDDDTLTWSLSGSDASSFELKGSSNTSRTLHFRSAPNYEAKSSYAVTVRVSDGSLSASVEVDVSVSNVEEAGSVSLSTTSPEVGSSITATLSDPDGNVSNLRWRWLRFSVSGTADETGEEVEGANGTDLTSTYTPTQLLAGRKLRARALYDDGHGTGKRAESVKTDAILGRPGKPGSLSASPGNERVDLSWSAADDNGSSIQYYEYRRSGGNWSTVSGGASARSQAVTGLTNGTEYTFEVRAVNDVGSGSAASVSATPIQPNRAPTLSGPEDPSGNENSTSSLGKYTARDDDDDTLTWSLAGTDKSAFQLKGSGSSRTLHFRSAPNYETKSSYDVTVQVSDGSLSASVEVDVSVSNVEEAGSVSLSTTSPEVGSSITATLSDPDGSISNLRWRWLRFSVSGTADGTEETEEEVEGANGTDLTSTYTPTQLLAGRKLRARALYDDGHGTGKRAESAKTDAVIGKPGKPGNLSASPGSIYTRVDLSWTAAAANGSSITDYQYQYLKSGTTSWSAWTSMGVVTSYTVSGLTSGASYDFRVRAVNGVGEGAYAQTSGRAQSRAEGEQTEEEQTEEEEEEQTEEEQTEEAQEPAAKPVSLTTQPDSVLAALAAPNPFNPTTTLHLHLPASGPVALTIYNLTGQVIRSLVHRSLEAGYHTFAWDGRDQHGYPVASGVYLYRLQAGQQVLVNKMALIR